MGNLLSGVAPAQILPVERYLADVPSLSKIEREGLIVAKVFVIHDPTLPLKPYKDHIEEVKNALKGAISCSPFISVLVTDKCAILQRQYGKDTLYDRLSTRPFLSMIEKRWIAFQLLKALEQCAHADVCHGDIKSENVLVSGWNWTVLTDFASFKPTYLPHDNPADFSYFFDTSRRRACYVAPERFICSSEMNAASNNLVMLPEEQCSAHQLTHSMDIFSLGCVLIELLSDGCCPFDFSQMLAFRPGNYNPQATLEKIECPHMRDLVSHMIQKEPKKRWNASQYLQWQRGKAFPETFYTFLWRYCQQFVTHPLMPFDKWPTQIKSSMPRVLSQLVNTATGSNAALIIILGIVTSVLRKVKYTSSKLCALSLLAELSSFIPSEIVLDRVLPYVLFMMSDTYPRVRAAALQTLCTCLNCVNTLPQTDLQIFPEFLLPKITNMASDHSSLVRTCLAENLGTLAEMSKRFLDYAAQNNKADPQVQEGLSNECINTTQELKNLREMFQEVVISLMGDSDNAVRRQLVEGGLLKLAEFFGYVKASDVLLSHMITFLNDKTDWELRASFYSCVPRLAAYIGLGSSTILKPLLQQGLRDVEEMVVFRTLVCLSELARLGLLRKPLVYEIVTESVSLLCHPNEWIRMATAVFICNLGKQLNVADVHCKLLPLINPYLKQPLIKLDNHFVFLQTLCNPIPRSVFDMVVRSHLVLDIMEFLQDKSLAKQLSYRSGQQNSRSLPEDNVLASFYQRLLNQGLTEEAEVKLLAYRDILMKMLKLRNGIGELSPSDPRHPGFINLSELYNNAIIVTRRHADLTLQRNSRRNNKQLVGSDWQQCSAEPSENSIQNSLGTTESVSTQEASMGGLTSSPYQRFDSDVSKLLVNPDETAVEALQESFAGSAQSHTSTEQVVSSLTSTESSGSTFVNKPHDLTTTMDNLDAASIESRFSMPGDFDSVNGHSYTGAMEEAAADALGHLSECRRAMTEFVEYKRAEFRRSFKPLSNSRGGGGGESSKAVFPPNSWRPQGKLLAHLHEHKAAVNRLCLHSNGRTFASCSNDGFVKLWDTEKLEGKNMTLRSLLTYAPKQGGRIKTVSFASGGTSFLCISDSGCVQLVRIDDGRSNGSLTSSLLLDSNDSGPPIAMEHYFDGLSDIALCATHHGHVICWDTRQSAPAFKFVNSFDHGLVTAMCLDAVDQQWLCLGTDRGHLVTWDLRFLLPVNVIKHPSRRRFERLWRYRSRQSTVFASVHGNGEVTLWDLETASRSLAIWPCEHSVLSYQQVKGITTGAVWFNDSAEQEPTFIVSGSSDTVIQTWELNDPQKSYRLSQSSCPEQRQLHKSQLVDGVQVLQSYEGLKTAGNYKAGSINSFAVGSNPSSSKVPMESMPTIAHHDAISDLIVTRASQWYLVSSSRDGVIKVWK